MNDETYKAIIEALAELEHEQWIYWSKTLAEKEKLSPDRVERWKKLWIPYAELSEEDKEHDRKWARRSLTKLLFILFGMSLRMHPHLNRYDD